ncbi:hypothetical protein M0R45_008644 [Rubus argutus]|uniref:DYW domain-containing protein n=1 Tax=Rubus argutus TaxID=59490 RepID=A0AAW1Y4C0_RUBAR
MGYTPFTSNVLHDIEEEEKEHTVGYHSEKLAVAFAPLNPKFGRELIFCDRNRFHHFINRSCSCQDYW